MLFSSRKSTLVEADQRPPRPRRPTRSPSARPTPCWAPRCSAHGRRVYEVASFGLGCFWGAERKFWQVPGVYSTAVGYQGGFTPNATYDEVCTRPYRSHRGGPGRLRPGEGELRGPAQGLLDHPRPDPGLPPGQRRRHAVPLRGLLDHRRAAGDLRGLQGDLPGRPQRPRASTRSPPKARPRRSSTTPRTTTSSTSTRCRTATTATPPPESPSPLGSDRRIRESVLVAGCRIRPTPFVE